VVKAKTSQAAAVEALYRELGPALYARAKRTVGDAEVAERLTLEAAAELATLGALPKAELARRGRELVRALCMRHLGVDELAESHAAYPRPKR
jgi:hypothetical protein